MKSHLEKTIFKDFRKELEGRYGADKAAKIWDAANTEYLRLEASEPDADKQSRSYVFPVVAIYRAVELFEPGEALAVTRAFGTKTGLRLKRLFRRITALPGIPSLMWKNMDKIAAKLSDGYDLENLLVDDHRCFMDVISCPLYEKAKALGTPEAVQMICCMDKEYMNGFRGVDYRRTKSVAEGDECCDYKLTRSCPGEKGMVAEKGKNELKKKTVRTLKGKEIFKEEIAKRISVPKCNKIWRDAHKRLYKMYAGHRDLPKGVSMHTDSFIFPAAAVYLAMKEVDSVMAYDVMKKIMAEKSAKTGKMIAKCCRIPGFRKIFLGMWGPLSHRLFGESDGFKNVFYPKEEGCFRMDIIQCPYHQYLTEQGCPELNILFCENDVHAYGHLPGLKFTRTGTIGAGSDRCDFKMELL